MLEYPLIPLEIKSALLRPTLLISGRYDAFQLAWKLDANLEALKKELAETEELLNDPDLRDGRMKPGASPRTYREGYLAGLQEVITLIRNVTNDIG